MSYTPEVRPKFEVEHVTTPLTLKRRTGEKVVEVIDGKSQNARTVYRMEYKTKEVTYDEHWLVYFPRKHFIRVLSLDELTRLGFNRDAPLVDLETGEDVPQTYGQMSLREACLGESRRQRA